METNEHVKTALLHEAEHSVLQLIETLQTIPEGDLQMLEQSVLAGCLSLGKRVLEQVLNQGGQGEAAPARRQGVCGHQQRLVGHRPKQLLTMMGKISLHRPYYHCCVNQEKQSALCHHGEALFDEVWGVQSRRTSPGVQKLLGMLVASMTLSEATSLFSTLLPLQMSERQALNLIQPVGEVLQQQEEGQVRQLFTQAACKQTQREESQQPSAAPIRRLYVELDGVMARMRGGSVPMEEHESRRGGDVYREIKVGAVFEATQGRERSELVEGVFVDEAQAISYVARRCPAEAFGPLLYGLAHRCGLERAEQVVVLDDGAVWIRRLVEEHFPQAIQIVDIFHAYEHLWKVAHAVYGHATPSATAWAKRVCDLLVEGRIETVVEQIEALPAIAPEPGASRSVPEIEADYFRTNAERMRYPIFRAQGMHIGSGVAEAACKTVVSTRAKRSGMRWTPDGLDSVLALRISNLNHVYDNFWEGRSHLVA